MIELGLPSCWHYLVRTQLYDSLCFPCYKIDHKSLVFYLVLPSSSYLEVLSFYTACKKILLVL